MLPSSEIEKWTRLTVVVVVAAFMLLSGLAVADGIESDVDAIRSEQNAALLPEGGSR